MIYALQLADAHSLQYRIPGLSSLEDIYVPWTGPKNPAHPMPITSFLNISNFLSQVPLIRISITWETEGP